MSLPPNVERSAFRPGEYVAYDGRGYVWHVRRIARQWRARPAPNNPAAAFVAGDTLTTVALALAQRMAPRVVEPF